MPIEINSDDPALITRVEGLRLLVFDFDGVFTDNSVYVSETGRESVRCNRSDGLGLRRLEASGIEPIILSTERNPVVLARARKLKIYAQNNLPDKALALRNEANKRTLALAEVGYVGNDINDVDCLQIAGLSIVVADAWPEVTEIAQYKTKRTGGNGAVREVCDVIHAIRTATNG